MPRRGMGVEICTVYGIPERICVMPRRGMGVEIPLIRLTVRLHPSHAPQGHGSRNHQTPTSLLLFLVMPRRGMGVEIFSQSLRSNSSGVMPRRGMGVEILCACEIHI